MRAQIVLLLPMGFQTSKLVNSWICLDRLFPNGVNVFLSKGRLIFRKSHARETQRFFLLISLLRLKLLPANCLKISDFLFPGLLTVKLPIKLKNKVLYGRVKHEYHIIGTLAYMAAWDFQNAEVFCLCRSGTGIASFHSLVNFVMKQQAIDRQTVSFG